MRNLPGCSEGIFTAITIIRLIRPLNFSNFNLPKSQLPPETFNEVYSIENFFKSKNSSLADILLKSFFYIIEFENYILNLRLSSSGGEGIMYKGGWEIYFVRRFQVHSHSKTRVVCFYVSVGKKPSRNRRIDYGRGKFYSGGRCHKLDHWSNP